MAHQTFYIDIDEEITSIVDRLRKAKAKEVVIVVPKRALLIQSIVNLKLLKKEAENLKKELIVVTQDKLGKLLVEKTGIAVEQRLEEIAGEEMEILAPEEKKQDLDLEMFEDDGGQADAKSRLENMGSTEYFEDDITDQKKYSSRAKHSGDKDLEEGIRKPEEKITNKELVTDIGEDIKKKDRRKKSGSLDIVRNIDIRQAGNANDFIPAEDRENDFPDFTAEKNTKNRKSAGKKSKSKLVFEPENLEKKYDNRFNDFFQNEGGVGEKSQKPSVDYGKVSLSGKFWKYLTILGLTVAAIVAIGAAYLFLPKAEIKIFVKAKTQSVDAQINGDANQLAVDFDKQAIPAKIISIDDQISENYPVTGSKSLASQKASGKVTVYNEFSSTSQPLIATTRLESPDGKIFRLVKSIVVPGMTNVGGEAKPGAIEVDVVADGSGDSYNIGPTTFTIPGFKDSGAEKYSKFYAKSFQAMAGGGGSGNVAKAITQDDISSAKNKTLADLTKSLKQKIKDSSSDAVVLDDAVNISDATYSVSNSEGEMVDNFTVTVKAKASAIIFSESDLKSVLLRDIAKASTSTEQINADSLNIQYGKSDTDFSAKNIVIRVNASGKIKAGVDLDNLKKGILGKTEDDFKAYLKAYSTIERAEISYWPSFMGGKIPAYESRVTIELDNN